MNTELLKTKYFNCIKNQYLFLDLILINCTCNENQNHFFVEFRHLWWTWHTGGLCVNGLLSSMSGHPWISSISLPPFVDFFFHGHLPSLQTFEERTNRKQTGVVTPCWSNYFFVVFNLIFFLPLFWQGKDVTSTDRSSEGVTGEGHQQKNE